MPKDQVSVPVNAELLADALSGLRSQSKRLSPKWFYDTHGSELFEEITKLAEYYPTRTEAAILKTHAERLANLVPGGGALVELGSGASVKTRTLLDAGTHFGAYVPIDIAADFLMRTSRDLNARYPDLSIHPVVGDFTAPVDLPPNLTDVPKVGFFPGSTIGNLEPEDAVALLSRARTWPNIQAFILGADLVKSEAELIAAYDDASGVTAAFNLNILARLNCEADGHFDLSSFRHEARWIDNRIEMHLVSNKAQEVVLADHTIQFAKGESIHTESCRKYTTESLGALASQAGWDLADRLTDGEGRYMVAVLKPDPDFARA